MGNGGRWMVIRRKSGKVVEESTVFVPATVKARRNKRKGTTTAQKRDENERDCVKRLARAINCNFAHGDLWLTAKYSDAGIAKLAAWAQEHQQEGQSWEDAMIAAAEREGKNYMRRLERELGKEGVVLRYLFATSDMDGETGEVVRIHHHIILPRVGFEAAAKKWALGTVDYQILRAQDDYTPLAQYICKQVRRRPDAKKYTSSRNLEKPIVNERWAKAGEELRVDSGGTLLHRNEWEPGRAQYIRFATKRDGRRIGGITTERSENRERDTKRNGRRIGGATTERVSEHGKAGGGARGLCAGTSKAQGEITPQDGVCGGVTVDGRSMDAATGARVAVELGGADKVICWRCGRMLGVMRDGKFENKHGRQIIRAERADVVCPKCGERSKIGAAEKGD